MRSLVLFLLTAAAFAQNSGTISGTVFDLQGQKVAKAPIQFTNLATGAVYKATSSDKGSYTLAQLPAGVYDLSVTVLGFNPYAQKNLAVASGQTLQLDIHLFDFQLGTLGDGPEFRVDQLTPHATPSGPTPRTRDDNPDLTGVWYAPRPVDQDKPEPLPWAEKLYQESVANNNKDA